MDLKRSPLEAVGWIVLALLLLATLIGTLTLDRQRDEPRVQDEPRLYAWAIAPLELLDPVRGPAVANALLLAVASWLAARSLRQRIGPAAPLWTAVSVFASVSFAFVFWGRSDLVLMACVAAGFALVYQGDRRYARVGARSPQIYEGEDTESGRGFLLRWLAAGALLGAAMACRPLYGALLLPAALAARGSLRSLRARAVAGLFLGAALPLLLSAALDWLGGGVDFPAAVRPNLNPRLAAWNVFYFLAGRNAGVLPYFLPLLLGFLAFARDRGRWAIPLAVAAAVLGFLLLRPFNFHGGGALGNRYFLPLYPALWFMAARPARAVWAVAAILAASPFLGPLWAHPTAYPVRDDGGYRHVSALAERWLPYETTQSGAPGREISPGGGLWVKVLSHNVWPSGRGGLLRIAGGSRGEMLVASPQPLHALHLEFDEQAPTRLAVGGEELRPLLLKADGYVLFEVPLGQARRVHPLWWGPYDYQIYSLDFRLPGAPAAPIGFRVLPPRDLIQRPRVE